HMREIMPTQLIRTDRSTTRPLDGASASSTLAAPVARLDGTSATAAEVFASTFTDALLVLHNGKVVDEHYFAGMTDRTPHLLMSVSKSIVGCVAGVLTERGLLDPTEPVTTYVPEAATSGYGVAIASPVVVFRFGRA